jgi:hypothetical protein
MFGIILAAAIVLASTGTAQTACNVVYTISPQNSSAFGAAITIDNTGTTAWTSWTLTWTFANGQTVSSLWSGIETQSGANVTVKNEPYNGSIAAGGSLSGIGFNGTWNGTTNAVPTSFAINGTTCGAPVGSFTLKPSAATLSIVQGASGTDTITVTDVSPFTGSVTLAASGLPTGVTAAFATNPATSTSVLTLTASSTATAGAATVTIKGTSGTLAATTTIALTVNTSTTPGFTLTPSPASLSVAQGKTGTDTITVADVGGFTGSVTLAATGLPIGVTVAYGTNPTTGTSVLTFTASATATAGAATVTITGTSGSTTAKTTIALTVTTSTPSFTLAPSATTLSVTQGKTATDTITVTDVNGFTGSVTLAATGLPGGVTVAYGTNPTTSTSVLTFTASATATAGTSTVTITGTSGSLTATTTIALTVTGTGGSFTLKSSASTLSIALSAGGTDTITVTDVGGFTGSVTLTASGMPSGVTAAFGTNPTTGSSLLTLTASSTATVGTSTITIQGTSTGTASGTLAASTTIALTVSSTPLVQIAWVSPAAGIAGSTFTVMPGVGASFAETQGSSVIHFGTTAATVTTWAIDSIAVTVPSLAVGTYNVTAVVSGVTSNAVPFTITSATPSPEVYTGNSTWFSALGSPYGGCGVPQAYIDSQNFVALNVQNDPGNYTLTLSRPISTTGEYASDIGMWDNGLNCGRWVHITMGDNCAGTNDGSGDEPFCRSGLGWVPDQFNGAELDFVVADSCQDENSWCRDDPYHLDQAQAALHNYLLNGEPAGNMYPNYWNNRQISWYFEPAPNYTGDINIGFLNGANAYWSAISITHLPNGIHGVQYLLNGVWTTAVMDADLGDDYIILPTVADGTQYEIQVFDVTNTLINSGRIYSFSYPASCGSSCTPALTPVTFITTQ